MAKKEEKKEEKKPKEPLTPEQEAAAAKKKKIIIIAAVGVLLLAGGAFAAIKILGSSSKKGPEQAAAEQADAPEHAEGHEADDASDHATTSDKAADHDDGSSKDGKKKDDAHSEKADAHGKPDDHAAKNDGHGASEHAESKSDGGSSSGKSGRYSGIGLMYDMKPFHLNLGNPLENRYVRLEVRFEYPNEEQKPELVARDSQIRDAIVSIVSRKTREHLLSPDGKDQLRLEIKNRVNQYLEKKITNVYITDILIE